MISINLDLENKNNKNYIINYIIFIIINTLFDYSNKIININNIFKDDNLYEFNITSDMNDHKKSIKYLYNQKYKEINIKNDDNYKYTNIIHGFGNLEFIITHIKDYNNINSSKCFENKNIIVDIYNLNNNYISKYFNTLDNNNFLLHDQKNNITYYKDINFNFEEIIYIIQLTIGTNINNFNDIINLLIKNNKNINILNKSQDFTYKCFVNTFYFINKIFNNINNNLNNELINYKNQFLILLYYFISSYNVTSIKKNKILYKYDLNFVIRHQIKELFINNDNIINKFVKYIIDTDFKYVLFNSIYINKYDDSLNTLYTKFINNNNNKNKDVLFKEFFENIIHINIDYDYNIDNILKMNIQTFIKYLFDYIIILDTKELDTKDLPYKNNILLFELRIFNEIFNISDIDEFNIKYNNNINNKKIKII